MYSPSRSPLPPPSPPDPSGSGEVTFVGHQPLASGSFGAGRMSAISANSRWLTAYVLLLLL